MCSFGEPLTVWSWLQLSGFVILSIGILMFNGTIKCCQDKPEENKESLVYQCLLKRLVTLLAKQRSLTNTILKGQLTRHIRHGIPS